MPQFAVGSEEWFKNQKKEVVRFARDLDSVLAAFVYVSRLLKDIDSTDYDISASLTTSFVINYARPFISKSPHPTRYLRQNLNFDLSIHDHIIHDLRHKLIAHADDEYSPGVVRLKVAAINLDFGSGEEQLSVPMAARVRVAALHSVYDRNRAEKFATHINAVFLEMQRAMREKLLDYLKAAQSFPNAILKMQQVESSESIEFSPKNEAMFSIPNFATNLPSRVPELMKGKDGYTYRELQSLQLTQSVRICDAEGNELVIVEKQVKA